MRNFFSTSLSLGLKRWFFLLLPLLFLFGEGQLRAQTVDPSLLYYPHNHLKWYSIRTEHFIVHFQEGNDRTAQVVSRIAEEIAEPMHTLYEHKPNTRVNIVLKDREDYSNGAAYFFDNKIDIWVPALDSPLRGTSNWLRNVITHEYTHIVQIQAAMKRKRTLPGIYLQWLGYENVRRPDVLYGYPNAVITYPLFAINVPAWFAEGTAQYMRSDILYDQWDAHRDMIMRTRVMNNKALSLDQMGTFSNKIAIEREVVYNSGYAFTRYLADRFGESVLRTITQALAKEGVQTITHAIELTTGINGYQVYEEWLTSLRSAYSNALKEVPLDTNTLLQAKGFVNFYPIVHPDGKRVFYLSNQGRDTYRGGLYVMNVDGSEGKAITGIDWELNSVGDGGLGFADDEHLGHAHELSCGFTLGSRLRPDASAFDIAPGGQTLVYSQLRLNDLGETYRDLHELSLGKRNKIRRITFNARLHEPSYAPDGRTIVAVQSGDGTQNLVLVDPQSGQIEALTRFTQGERLYRPFYSPDGEWIYLTYADTGHRSIRRFHLADRRIEVLLSSPETDYRDPVISADGRHLYYSANHHGIFNIWKMALDDRREEQLTSVLGGAFMPDLLPDGSIVYAEYQWDGYKIARTSDRVEPLSGKLSYRKPLYARDTTFSDPAIERLNRYDDTTVAPLLAEAFVQLDKGETLQRVDSSGVVSPQAQEMYAYKDEFTSFSYYPAIRFDNYSKPNGNNSRLIGQHKWASLGENLWRDLKMGVYVASRDVTDQFTLFGGILVGMGSQTSSGFGDFVSPARLIKLDRDMFLQLDYKGLPFIKKGWSPTVSISLTNLRRNVQDGLSIEEFPCIACLPDTVKTDVAYDIFETALYLRSKLQDWNYLELGVSYSPYRVSTSSFYSREYQTEITGSSSRYFIGSRYSLAYVMHRDLGWQHSDVAPIGLRGWLRYSIEPGKLLDRYSLDNGRLNPEYLTQTNHSLDIFARYGFKALDQHFQLNVQAYAHLRKPLDDFYLSYYGGLTGMRSYPFFALGGYQTAYSTLSWNFPVVKRIDRQLNRFTFDKVYGRLFAEAGQGWGNPLSPSQALKTGLGAELRFGLVSNYMLPTRFFVSGAYGFNPVTVRLPDPFITADGKSFVTYGKEWLFHFGLMFDFEL